MSTKKKLGILSGLAGILAILVVMSVMMFGPKQTSSISLTSQSVTKTPTSTAVSVDSTSKIYRLTVNESSIVTLDTDISDESVDATIKLLSKALEDNDTAYLFIDSPGGGVFAGTKLVSFIEGSKQAINTVCIGICASMGFHIFEAGHARYMTDNAGLMAHPAAGGLSGTVPEMKSLLTFIDEYTARLDKKVAKRAGIPYGQFQQLVLANLWTTSDQSISMGLADKVVAVTVTEGGFSPNKVSDKLFDDALNDAKRIKKALE